MNKFWLRVAFLLPKGLVYASAARMLNSAIQGRNLSRDQIMKLRFTAAMNRWKGYDGTESRFKKGANND